MREYRGNNSDETLENLDESILNREKEEIEIHEENRDILVKIKEGKLRFGITRELEGKVIKFGGGKVENGGIKGICDNVSSDPPDSETGIGLKSDKKVPNL